MTGKPREPEQDTKARLIQGAKDVAKWAAVVYGGLSIFLVGAQAALVKLLTKPGELTDDAIGFYLNVFTHAAPLTFGMTLVGILWSLWARSNAGSDDTRSFFGMTMLTALILVVSTAIGNYFGVGARVEQHQLVGNWPMGTGVVINALYSYYLAYEKTLFFSSLVVAGFLTVVWVRKIEPLVNVWLEMKEADKKAAGGA